MLDTEADGKVATKYSARNIFTITARPKPVPPIPYEEFLQRKVATAQSFGFEVQDHEINPILKPHQRLIVRWACRGGRRAVFAAFGLGKSVIQLEIVRMMLRKASEAVDAPGRSAPFPNNGVAGSAGTCFLEPKHATRGAKRGVIVLPLGVRQEFYIDASMLGITVHFVRTSAEVLETSTLADGTYPIFLTNYESVREGKIDPSLFEVVSLDEAAILRGFGGTKTFREFMRLWECCPYRFVATATPSPNEYIELLAYAAFLGIMEVSEAKTRFFKRDSTKADHLTLHAHKEEEFWLWVASWALFLQKPSDLGEGYSDEGYELPELRVIEHEVAVDHLAGAGFETWGQARMFRDGSLGMVEASREKRDTLPERVAKMVEILAESPDDHFVLWHDLEAERHAIEKAVPGVVSVWGNQSEQSLEEREAAVIGFRDGKFQYLAAKPVMLGSGCNLQYHCHKAVFLGIGYKFADFIQAIHRLYRFLQRSEVEIHLIYAESERGVRATLQRKWDQHKKQVAKMTEIIQKYGLTAEALSQALMRSMGVDRIEVSGPNYRLINNDNVPEMRSMAENSVDFMLSSWPFGTQYEYSENYRDFGHTDSNAHFFEQLDYLTPESYRVLRPGRLYAVHVKDRIVPGGMTGLGFQTVYPFHCDCISHMVSHGFAFMGMCTITTDVVRENNQTYRLGWSEKCKDGTKIGFGMSEYILLFRKPPTDSSNGYADVPVKRQKPLTMSKDGETMEFHLDRNIIPGTGYSRARWQLDAKGDWRSGGNRFLTPAEYAALDHDVMYKVWKRECLAMVYDFEHHVKIGEGLESMMALPTSFMLLPPHATHHTVWTDVARMRTLNGNQYAAGKEMHLCPFQFDVVERCIELFSEPGETVLDPFGGLMTVPYMAVKMGRVGIGIELASDYFLDGCAHVKAAAEALSTPSLFDLIDVEASEPTPNPLPEGKGQDVDAVGYSARNVEVAA